MQLKTKELEYCKTEVFYEADSETVSSLRDEVVADLRGVQIPGFRKGKAPDSAIKVKLKKVIDKQLLAKLRHQAYDDFIFEKGVKTIGAPTFEESNLNGDRFSCRFTTVQKPEFELKDFNYEIPSPDIDRDVNSKVEKFLQDARLKLGDFRPFEENEFVDYGDQVTMSFTSTIDGQPFDGSVAEGQLYIVGNHEFSDFDDALLGMSPGETREFDVMFPDNFPEIGGKTAHFSVTIHMGTRKIPHPLDDDLAKKCGMESLDELKEKLFKIEDAKIKQAEAMELRKQVVNRLVEDNSFKVPDCLVEMESQFSAMKAGLDWNSLEESEKDVFKESAMKSVKLSLILDSIREQEPDSVLSDIEALNSLKRRAELHGQDPNKLTSYAEKNNLLFGMLTAIKDEYTVQFVVNKAKVIS